MGVTPEQILGRTVVELDVEDAALHDAADNRLVAGDGEPAEQVYETTTVVGRRWLKARKALVRDEGGRPTHILTLADDITDRVLAQQRLAASRTFLELDRPASALAADRAGAKTGRFVLANLATRDGGLGPRATLLGKRARDVLSRGLCAAHGGDGPSAPRLGRGRVDEEIVDPGRQPAEWHHVRKAVIPDESGNGRYVLTIDEDISDRRRMLEELSRSEASLRRSQAIARIGSWRREAAGGRIEWSEEMYRLLGIEPDGADLSLKGVVTADPARGPPAPAGPGPAGAAGRRRAAERRRPGAPRRRPDPLPQHRRRGRAGGRRAGRGPDRHLPGRDRADRDRAQHPTIWPITTR